MRNLLSTLLLLSVCAPLSAEFAKDPANVFRINLPEGYTYQAKDQVWSNADKSKSCILQAATGAQGDPRSAPEAFMEIGREFKIEFTSKTQIRLDGYSAMVEDGYMGKGAHKQWIRLIVAFKSSDRGALFMMVSKDSEPGELLDVYGAVLSSFHWL